MHYNYFAVVNSTALSQRSVLSQEFCLLLHLSKTGVGLVQSAGAGVSWTTRVPFSLESMPAAGWSVLGGVHGQSERDRTSGIQTVVGLFSQQYF